MFYLISVDIDGMVKMMKKHLWLIILVVVSCAVLIAFFILQHNSLTLQFRKHGYAINEIEKIYISKTDDHIEYAVCRTKNKEGNTVLVLAEKNKIGLWIIAKTKEITDENPFVSIALLNISDISRYDYDFDMSERCEWHYFYCGNDAIKSISTLHAHMPKNVAVNVRQAGAEYIIHIISFEQLDLDVRTVLCDCEFVAS